MKKKYMKKNGRPEKQSKKIRKEGQKKSSKKVRMKICKYRDFCSAWLTRYSPGTVHGQIDDRPTNGLQIHKTP